MLAKVTKDTHYTIKYPDACFSFMGRQLCQTVANRGQIGCQHILLMLRQVQLITLKKKQTCLGFLISCIAALSTYMCESSMSGYSEASAVTLFLQSMDACNNIVSKGLY